MSQVGEMRQDLQLAAEEAARLRSFMQAIYEQADPAEDLAGAAARLANIRRLAEDAGDPQAPVPGRVAQLWREDQG